MCGFNPGRDGREGGRDRLASSPPRKKRPVQNQRKNPSISPLSNLKCKPFHAPPPPGAARRGRQDDPGLASVFAGLELFFTLAFALELALNMLAHWFRPFYKVSRASASASVCLSA